MSHLILACLILLVVFLAYRHWLLCRGVRLLADAVQHRRPLLDADNRLPQIHASWRKLAAKTNDLIRDNEQFSHRRSDQLFQLETALGNLQEAVIVLDESNYILFANRALETMFPSGQDTVGKRVETVLRSGEFLSYLDEVRGGRSSPRREVRFNNPGADVCAEITGVSVPHTSGPGAPWTLFVIHDVTRERQLENVRKEFVANVSHELKTPLSVIKGYSETLVDDQEQMDASQREQFIRAIHRHAERLAAIIEDLLSLSRLESSNPGMQLAVHDLTPFLRSIVDDFSETISRSGLTLSFSTAPAKPLFANVDPLRLTQVFANLIENARKYTPAGTSVWIGAEKVETDGEVELSVEDNGPGIPPSDLPRIFERFYRVEKGRSRGKGGTGLGLSIVKHIVQLHNGRVWAESTWGKGTRIVIRLPLSPGESADAAESESSSTSEKSANSAS